MQYWLADPIRRHIMISVPASPPSVGCTCSIVVDPVVARVFSVRSHHHTRRAGGADLVDGRGHLPVRHPVRPLGWARALRPVPRLHALREHVHQEPRPRRCNAATVHRRVAYYAYFTFAPDVQYVAKVRPGPSVQARADGPVRTATTPSTPTCTWTTTCTKQRRRPRPSATWRSSCACSSRWSAPPRRRTRTTHRAS